jgi:hypothetical protein
MLRLIRSYEMKVGSGSPMWRVVSCPRLATVARGVFPCPRLATNAGADSRPRLQLCRLASAQLTVFPHSVLCTQLTRKSKSHYD